MKNSLVVPLFQQQKAGIFLLILCMFHAAGCAGPGYRTGQRGTYGAWPPGSIISTEQMGLIETDEMISDLISARIVYIGETHTKKADHQIQLLVIKEMYKRLGDRLVVGMEMFDRTYDPVLEQWTSGFLSEEEFIEKTHWYANWRYDFDLYRDILLFLKEKKIPLKGLNMPFFIPPKIREGGLDSLRDFEKAFVPKRVDKSFEAQRKFLEKIFSRHPFASRVKFEYFFEAQAARDDAMADSIAGLPGDGVMIVLVGKGHLHKGFGLPDRVYKRNGLPFRVVSSVKRDADDETGADYLHILK